MARARSAQTPTQLTLDDWAETLSASPDVSETPRGRATTGSETRSTSAGAAAEPQARPQSVATELLEMPGALLTRTHLRELGLERRAVDAVFRALPVVALPGYSRPMIRADQYVELLERSTYDDDRVRPSAAIMSSRSQGA